VSANKKEHLRGASVKITDYPILAYLRNLLNAESGYTLPNTLKYVGGVVPSTDDDLVDKGYVDALAFAGANLTQVAIAATAGETISDRNLVYFKESDQRWWKTDADALATLGHAKLGVALGAGTAGSGITGGVALIGYVSGLSGLTAGAKLYVSATAGAIASGTPGTIARFVGWAISTTTMILAPDELLKDCVIDTAGELLAAGDLVYFKESDQKWWKTDADAAATSLGVKLAFAQAAISADTLGLFRTAGVDQSKTGLTPGGRYYVSGTAGGLATTPGAFARLVGLALSAQELLIIESDPTAVHIWNQEVYAADAVGTDTYAVTLPVSPVSYFAGFRLYVKVATANTGAASLNVNGIGAVTIKKNVSVDLETGDILANQILELVHDGTNFQIINRLGNDGGSYATGVASRALDAASGDQTIAHGLGRVPKFIRVTTKYQTASSENSSESVGAYNGTLISCVWLIKPGASAAGNTGQSSANIAEVYNGATLTDFQKAVPTVDATNITLAWTKGGTPGSKNIEIMWEAFA
jgi:hypothetical protein